MLYRNGDQRQESHWDWFSPASPVTAIFLVILALVLALVLRIWHIRHGLPDFQEEAIPFKQALEMWGWETGRTDLNPHFFNYPTFSIYIHFALQKLHYTFGMLTGRYAVPADYWLLYHLDPTPQVILARLVGIVSDGATLLGVWVIGERMRRGAGLLAALLIALAPTVLLTGRSIYSDSVMTALAVWALERLLAYLTAGGRGRLLAALVLIGLAAGAKYTAGLLVVPLAAVLWLRHGGRGLLWWPLAAAGSFVVFLISSPYVLLDFQEFWHDFTFERLHMSEGHFGTYERRGALFQLKTIIYNLGWPALLSLVTSGVLAIRRRQDPAATTVLILWLILLPHAVSVAFFRMEAARYLLALLPAAVLLAAWGTVSVAALWPFRQRRVIMAIMLIILVLPPLRAGIQAAASGGDTTQQLARSWCQEQLEPQDIIVQEPYGANLPNVFDLERIRRKPSFPMASPELQSRFLTRACYRSIAMPMATSGKFKVNIDTWNGNQLKLNVFEQVSDFNQIFYTPSLYRDVDYFLVSGTIRQRYEANPARYRQQIRFYEMLDDHAEVAVRFRASGRATGAEVVIFSLGNEFQDWVSKEMAPFSPFWWAQAVPVAFRMRADELLVPPDKHSQGDIRLPDGLPAHWVRSMVGPFNVFLLPFLAQMAHHLSETGHYREGRRFAAAVLAMRPDLEIVCLVFSRCASEMGDWEQARRAVVNSLNALGRQGRESPQLRYELARLLHHFGETTAARQELELLLRMVPTNSDIARSARQFLELVGISDQAEQNN